MACKKLGVIWYIKPTFWKPFPFWSVDDDLQLGHRGKEVTMETSDKLREYGNSMREGGGVRKSEWERERERNKKLEWRERGLVRYNRHKIRERECQGCIISYIWIILISMNFKRVTKAWEQSSNCQVKIKAVF